MKKKRVAALVMAAILGVTGFSVPGIGVVQAEEAHTEMSGEAEQQEINLAADRGSTARASKFLAASGNLPAREPGLAFDGISDNNGEADNSRWQSGSFGGTLKVKVTMDGKVERTRSFQSSGWK